MAEFSSLVFPPRSRAEVARIESAGKRLAFERARRAPFYAGRLDHIDPARLDETAEWSKIPILDKEELRAVDPATFHERFCIAPDTDAVEYWRSGGSTGRPLFYPRSAVDMDVARAMWRRLWHAPGVTAADKAHISFPMGIHPVGQLYARCAEELGVSTIWAGSGSNTPSELQVELIRTLKPTVWCGMPSYGLQLASLAERADLDLSKWTVRKIICAAEPLSTAKRAKLEKMWNAEVFDQYGCTEIGGMASESERHDGLHIWTDLAFVEVVDETTGEPVPAGEPGLLILTPHYTNTMTPFLRWNTGDIVTLVERGETDGAFSVFPMVRHSKRTSGFFKVRGVNINHNDFEDFMHRYDFITDFRLEVADGETLDEFRLQAELRKGISDADAKTKLTAEIKQTFEVTPAVECLAVGTLAQIFLTDIKAKRFVDSRSR